MFLASRSSFLTALRQYVQQLNLVSQIFLANVDFTVDKGSFYLFTV